MDNIFKGEILRQDTKAKSLSYYFTSDVVFINEIIIKQLIELSSTNNHCNARICLHRNPKDNFHEMIIMEYSGNYYRPHKHLMKGESCHIIEGNAYFAVFDDAGRLQEHCLLGSQGHKIARAGINRWHVVIPATPYAIYHESKPGPYLGANDSVFPGWAPDGLDHEAAQSFQNELTAHMAL